MKQETLEKIVELADGFEMDLLKGYVPYVKYLDRRHIAKYITKWEHYPLLLRRAAEGVNSNGKYEIYLYINYILLESNNHPLTEGYKDWDYSDYKKTDYLTPCEQALEACLIELLEK